MSLAPKTGSPVKKPLAIFSVFALSLIAAGVFALRFSSPVGVSVDKISFLNDPKNANGQVEVTLVNSHTSSFQISGSNGIVTEFSIRNLDETFIAGRTSNVSQYMTVEPGKKIMLRFADYDLPKVVLLRLEIFDWLGRPSVILKRLDLDGAVKGEAKRMDEWGRSAPG